MIRVLPLVLKFQEIQCFNGYLDASVDFGQSRIFFMHNWRCGGTTLTLLFSSNFGNKYLKVGTQFSEFGWPLYQLPELLKLEDVRSKVQSGCLLGGHLCNGIEMLVPGKWDSDECTGSSAAFIRWN